MRKMEKEDYSMFTGEIGKHYGFSFHTLKENFKKGEKVVVTDKQTCFFGKRGTVVVIANDLITVVFNGNNTPWSFKSEQLMKISSSFCNPKPKYWVEIDERGLVAIKGYRKKHSFIMIPNKSSCHPYYRRYSRQKYMALDFCRATGLELREEKE